MVNIIKLDEYLEKHRYNIAKATADALGMNSENSDDVQYTLDLYNKATEGLESVEMNQLSLRLTDALKAQDAEEIRTLLQVRDVDTWEEHSFDGVDIIEGFNFRCEMKSESSRNGLMDWLEENSVEYLIDNDGNFAIKCPSRKQHYHVNRYVENLSNKWERPSFGKNIDPTTTKKNLGNISRPALSDGINEADVIQGPWGNEPREFERDPPMTPELSRKSRISYMTDEELFNHAYNALDTEIIHGSSGGNIDVALDYITSGYEPDQNKKLQGMRIALKNRYEEEFGRDFAAQRAWLKKTVGQDTIVRDESIEEDAKDSNFKDSTYSESPFTDVDRDEKDEKKKNESIMEGNKNKKKKKEKGIKAKVDDELETAKTGSDKVSSELSQGQYQPKTIPDKKKMANKKKGREKVTVESDKIEEGLLGDMPNLGRMRELAGLKNENCSTPDGEMMTIVVKPDPGTPKIEELPGVSEAKDLMSKAFDIYNTLPEESQGVFQSYMIANMMGTAIGLKEGIDELNELERPDRRSEPLTRAERYSLANRLRQVRLFITKLVTNWRVRTKDVDDLEMVIILLNKLETKIGQGGV